MTQFQPLTPEEVDRINWLFAEVVVPVMIEEHKSEDGRAAAILEVRDSENVRLSLCKVGKATQEKLEGYQQNAIGKNDALERYPQIQLSWEVHRGNTDHKPYPGGIKTPFDDRIAISGFTWERDTIGCLWLAYQAGRIGIADAATMAGACGIRPQFLQLTRKMNSARQMCEQA